MKDISYKSILNSKPISPLQSIKGIDQQAPIDQITQNGIQKERQCQGITLNNSINTDGIV